jgi:Zn-dependent M28 family amino/carboxypeptidase
MWGSEESGGSSEAYAKARAGEMGNLVVASESDLGGDRIYALMLPQGAAVHPIRGQLLTLLAPLKIFVSSEAARSGGADTTGLQAAGVPVFSLRQDASRYFDFHHSEDDTLDKVDRRSLDHNVAAWAAVIYMIADSDIDFRALKDAK